MKLILKTATISITGAMVATGMTFMSSTSAAVTPTQTVVTAYNSPLQAQAAAKERRNLKQGSHGSFVLKLQRVLGEKGYFNHPSYTRYFGPATERGLKAWQRQTGRRATGRIIYRSSEWRRLHRSSRSQLFSSACNNVKRAVCVSIPRRKAQYVVNGRIVKVFDVRTGRRGMETTTGVFSVGWKSKHHRSRKYNMTPMPYAMFFHGGEALHYSEDFRNVGYNSPGSHGCVNFRDKAGIAWLFDQMQVYDRVVVVK